MGFFSSTTRFSRARLKRTTEDWRLNEKSSYFDFASNYTQRNSLSMFDNEKQGGTEWTNNTKNMNEKKNESRRKELSKRIIFLSICLKVFFFSLNDRIFLSIVSKYAFHIRNGKLFSMPKLVMGFLSHSILCTAVPAPLIIRIQYVGRFIIKRRVACARRCREPSLNVVESEMIMLAGNWDCEAFEWLLSY